MSVEFWDKSIVKSNELIIKDLSHLKNEVLTLEDKLPIKEIEKLIELNLDSQTLLDKVRDLLFIRKDFDSIMNKYACEMEYPLYALPYRQIFFYLLEHGYVFLHSNSINPFSLKPFIKKIFKYDDFEPLNKLFNKNFTWNGIYYEIEDLSKIHVATTLFKETLQNLPLK